MVSRPLSYACVALVLGCSAIASAQTCGGQSTTVHEGGSFILDGNVGPGTAPNAGFVIGTPGAINQEPLWHVSKFKLDTILPPGTTSADIICATISVPDNDRLRNGQPGIHDFSLEHFATTSNTSVTGADGGFGTPVSPALAIFKPVGGGRDPLVLDPDRVAIVDVTEQIKDDLDNGRALSSWRWGIGPLEAPATTGAPGGDNYTFPDSDGVGTSFDFGLLMELTILATTQENCSNGIDDDGDGDVDCDDSDCAGREPCLETICDDGLDGDNDGLTDCDDLDCTDDPACPEDCSNGVDDDSDGDVDCDDSECATIEPCVETICDDGIDGDNDGLTDCDDLDCTDDPACPEDCSNGVDDDGDGDVDCNDVECFCDPGCTPPPTELACDNGFDDDCDGDVDCDDSDCAAVEPCAETVCDDGLDGDNDGLIDCDDPDCSGVGSCPTILSMRVSDSGNTSLDATSQFLGESPNLTFVIAISGSNDEEPIWFISKFKLDTILPTATMSGDIISATLSIPDQATIRANGSAGGPAGLNLVLHHFPTTNDNVVTDDDRHENTPALFDFGTVIPIGGTGNAGTTSVVNVDVTDAVKDDLNNGRALSSFRVGHDPDNLVGHSGADAYQWGSADCSILNDGDGLPSFCPPEGDPNVMKLTIVMESPCNNPFADADGDGDVDQRDFASLQRCLTGSGGGIPATPDNCFCFDIDNDTDIDRDDVDRFIFCASGPTVAADPTCDD